MKKKMNLNTNFTLSTKNNSKWIINLSMKHKTIQLLENNIGLKKIKDLGFSRILNTTSEDDLQGCFEGFSQLSG